MCVKQAVIFSNKAVTMSGINLNVIYYVINAYLKILKQAKKVVSHQRSG